MVNFTAGDRRTVRWDGSDWTEEVLAASGVQADTASFSTVTGTYVQDVLEAIDNTLSGIDYSTSSGVVHITDVDVISGALAGTLGNNDVVNLPSAEDSVLQFSMSIPAQPVNDAFLRVFYAVRGAGAGNLGLNLDYTYYELTDDLSSTTFVNSGSLTLSVSASSTDQVQLANFTLPTTEFTSAGSAPYIAVFQLTRDTSVGSNVTEDVSIIDIYADNIPGAQTGNTAGYIGGNLIVTGDLTVEGRFVIEDTTIPASASDTGVSGTLVFDDNFAYFATDTNTWKRVALGSF